MTIHFDGCLADSSKTAVHWCILLFQMCIYTLPVLALKRRYNSGPKPLKAVKQGPYSRELGGVEDLHISLNTPLYIPLIEGSLDP